MTDLVVLILTFFLFSCLDVNVATELPMHLCHLEDAVQ